MFNFLTKKRLFFSVFVLFFLFSCSDSSEKPKVSPYAGSWKVVFSGTAYGSGTIFIGSDGDFSFPVYLTTPYGSITNTVIGSVSSRGNLKADIFYQNEKIGSASGRLYENTGSGTYTTYENSGTWYAERL